MRILKDDEFIRAKVPMTKEEVRTLSLVKMDIKENSRILDVGAGTGSVSINAAVNCPKGEVIAIEKEDKAVELIKLNIEKLGIDNMKVIHGMALEEIKALSGKFNSIFIGGSGGELEKIIDECYELLHEGGSIVLNFITLSNAVKAMDKLEEIGMEYECVQVAVNRIKGKSKMILANNPIFIINGMKTKE
ncbi:precorrin-6Y C5,15-methyltransferase (decarboxylating) subunit CbiT [Oceanirhabdus sp. W0125-5]|uniref:precorrin-6Y C5,15-methyltransferase (decarboxylating) subunit CbiT n=1 Tax=Oceanirhabdus sp. W0125-5 TaxID=2999116 RepID=UPI0022F2F2A2|nr:precorrin-6Y C5,15-methyltransferase (decarboxylating) subunit CbiT [Oceanirhabdus sp. W0125-5]WBW96180.1 precorrin-6Y C5,15-methyltransferase (decarboxylating) subunit CbiT [Oceanirhabdus sp. W0125-5]